MKWLTRKLATIPTNSEWQEENTQPIKRNFFIRIGIRMGRGIVKGLKKKNTYVEFISALLIILFIYTGLNKMMDIEKFKYEMGRSPFIQNISVFIAYTLPVGEMLLAFLLVIKRTRLIGLYLSFAIMALFTGYIWLMLNYAYDLPCSCGGIISKLSWHDHLVFNSIFTGLAIIAVLLQSKIVSAPIVRLEDTIVTNP